MGDDIPGEVREVFVEIFPEGFLPIWWRECNRTLGGRSPRVVSETPEGLSTVVNLLHGIADGNL